MTPEEKQDIQNVIKSIQEMDILFIIASNNPTIDINEFYIREFTVVELVNDLERALIQLDEELNTSNYIYLPNRGMSDVTLNGRYILLHAVQQIKSSIDTNELSQLFDLIVNLIKYQMKWGFWGKSERKIHHVDEIKLKQQQTEVTVLIKKINKSIADADNLTSSLNIFYDSKLKELDSLTSYLNKANNDTIEISKLWETSTRLKSEIETIQNQTKDSLDLIKNQLKNQNAEYENLKLSIEQKEEQINVNLLGSKVIVDDIKSSGEEIKSKTAEAKRLLGLSADAALGGKFSLREIKVSKALIWWRVAIVISVVLSVGWAVTVFLCLATKTDLPYLDFLVNVLKTSPGFVLMGYIMSQYNKERIIEEEYAFRAAISETINAYADLLESQDDADKTNESRQKMLLEAIKQVYSKPVMHQEKISANTYKEQSKELLDILKQIKLPKSE